MKNEIICLICLVEIYDNNYYTLPIKLYSRNIYNKYSNCKCIGYVHHYCLNEWFKYSNKIKCPICNINYKNKYNIILYIKIISVICSVISTILYMCIFTGLFQIN